MSRFRVALLLLVALVAGCDEHLPTAPVHRVPDEPSGVLLKAGTVAQVSVGGDHTCALRMDGTLVCWGENTLTQANAERSDTYTQVIATDGYTCALSVSGDAVCWGGARRFSASSAPGPFTQISMRAQFACGLRPDRTLACWGGLGFFPPPIPPGGTFTRLSTDGFCAIRTNGTLACWETDPGWGTPPAGTFSQLGGSCAIRTDGTLACWRSPYLGQLTPPAGTFTQVSNYCGIRTDSTLACWGPNVSGQSNPPSGAFTQVSASLGYACAIRNDGAVICWGNDGYGQSSPPPTDRFTELSTGGTNIFCGVRTDGTIACWGGASSPELRTPSGTFTQVSGGENHSCALHTDGTLACWGDDTYGQATPPSGTFVQVDGGGGFTCAIRTNATLACWGQTTSGVTNPPDGAFTRLSAGGAFACGIRTNGTIACWGESLSGQTRPPAGTFTQLSSGRDHACAIRTEGTLACWGWNAGGMATPPNGIFTQVSAGSWHTCALKPDGGVTCFGYQPTDVGAQGVLPPAPEGSFTRISVGAGYTCALETNQTVACWGKRSISQTPPRLTAVAGGPYSGAEGTRLALDGSASIGPKGEPLTFAWSFGDGATGSGTTPSHTWVDNGVYTVTLTVTDAAGASQTNTTTATIANVAPIVDPFTGATILRGETYESAGSFTDPGADAWTATVDWGDGSGTLPLALDATTFSLEHEYLMAGRLTTTVRVSDDDGGIGTQSATVVVLAPVQAIAVLSGDVGALAGTGALSVGESNALTATLAAAKRQLERGNTTAAVNEIGAFDNKVAALVRSRRLDALQGATLTAYAARIMRSIAVGGGGSA